jgi:RNA polymerase sigma-70 factor (ECF subfamily)
MTRGGQRPAGDRSTEVALVRRARRRDAAARRELVEHLLPHLRAVAGALLGRTADVDDAVQITLMRVLENLSSWRGDGPLHHWARTVAARACLRLAEQNRRHARALATSADVEDLVAPGPDVSLREALPRPVHDYLDRLPSVQREVVVLRHALDHSVAEIAELTGVSIGTVKSRLLFGRRALRKLLRRDDRVGDLATALRRRAEG